LKSNSLGSGESKLETLISYLLIAGVIISLILETIGLILFCRFYDHLSIRLEDKGMFIQGQNFFSFLHGLFNKEHQWSNGVLFMTLGIATLMLTPYLRVITSALYFTWKKEASYIFITLFVLIVLTVSLALH
jgi:uncharacterized membrane protein